jgi:hypothetical protein
MNQELQKTDSAESQIALNERNPLIGKWITTSVEHQVARTYGEKQIGEFSRNDMTMLVELMAQWRIHIGFTGDAMDNELVFICQFLYDNFKHFTISDIRLAMNWAINGKLDLSYVSTKTLSSLYVSKALNLYEEEKRRIVNQISEQKQRYIRNLELSSKIEQTPLDKANSFKEHIISVYEKYKSDGVLIDIGDLIYTWIRKNKIIEINAVDVEKATSYAQEKYLAERMNQSYKNTIVGNIDDGSKEIRKKKLAREYIIAKYFDSVNVINIINSIKVQQFK